MADRKLDKQVAVVAGATRSAGRGIACMLGEAGATVYCIGRSTRNGDDGATSSETIEETAEMVEEYGGEGIAICCDLRNADQVGEVFERIESDVGQLDLLVNNLSGDEYLTHGMLSGQSPVRFWDYPIEKGLATQVNGVHTHLISCYHAARMMTRQRHGLIVEVTDGNRLAYNDVGVYYSLSKTSLVLLAYLMSEELRDHHVAVVSLTPGWLRSEKMLNHFGVTEDRWRDAIAQHPGFEHSETPFYIGKAVVALATDPNIMDKTGRSLSAGFLAREYAFTDIDGSQPPGYAWGSVPIVEGAFKDGCFGPVAQ